MKRVVENSMDDPMLDEMSKDRLAALIAKADVHALHRAALAADDAFHAAVVAQFGEKDAGDMRYRTGLHNAATLAAGDATHKATNAYLLRVKTLRSCGVTFVPGA